MEGINKVIVSFKGTEKSISYSSKSSVLFEFIRDLVLNW